MPAAPPEQQKEHRRMGISAEAVGRSSGASAAKAWARALARTAAIRQHRSRILSTVVDEMAEKYTNRPAVIADDGILTYGALADRAHRYARWAVDHGVGRGAAVGLLMPNRPEYLAIWLGI